MPMAIWSTITWIRNPAENGEEVAIQKLTLKHVFLLIFFGVLVTVVFGCLLYQLNTPNILLSTLSIATGFFAVLLFILLQDR